MVSNWVGAYLRSARRFVTGETSQEDLLFFVLKYGYSISKRKVLRDVDGVRCTSLDFSRVVGVKG